MYQKHWFGGGGHVMPSAGQRRWLQALREDLKSLSMSGTHKMLVFTISVPPPKCMELHVSVVQRLTPGPGNVSEALVWWWRPCYALAVTTSPPGGPEISKYLGYLPPKMLVYTLSRHPSVWNCMFQCFRG